MVSDTQHTASWVGASCDSNEDCPIKSKIDHEILNKK